MEELTARNRRILDSEPRTAGLKEELEGLGIDQAQVGISVVLTLLHTGVWF